MAKDIVETALYWNTPFVGHARNLQSALICLGSIGVRVERCRFDAYSACIQVQEFPHDINEANIEVHGKFLSIVWNSVTLIKLNPQHQEANHG